MDLAQAGLWGCFQNWVSGIVFEASLSAKLDRISLCVHAAFLQVLRVRNSFGLSRQERFKRGISVAIMMKTFIPRTNSRNI